MRTRHAHAYGWLAGSCMTMSYHDLYAPLSCPFLLIKAFFILKILMFTYVLYVVVVVAARFRCQLGNMLCYDICAIVVARLEYAYYEK